MHDLIKNFYEEIYSKPFDDTNWTIRRSKFALKFIPIKSIILNLGCGIGADSREFISAGHCVYGCDISERALDVAVNVQDHTELVDLNVIPYPYRNKSFSVIYSSEVVEHLPLIEPFLKECYRILKLNGLLILTTNNPAYYKNRINLLLGTSDWTAQQGHLHYYTPKKLKEFLSENGFKIIVCENIGNTPFVSFGNDYIIVSRRVNKTNE